MPRIARNCHFNVSISAKPFWIYWNLLGTVALWMLKSSSKRSGPGPSGALRGRQPRFDWSEFDLGCGFQFTKIELLTSLNLCGFCPIGCRNNLGLLLAGVHVTAHGGWRFDEKLIMSNVYPFTPLWENVGVIHSMTVISCDIRSMFKANRLSSDSSPCCSWTSGWMGLQLGIMRW